MPQCTASAPGKVLVAGGYLVLVRPNVGVVVGMSARFTSTVAGEQQRLKAFPKCIGYLMRGLAADAVHESEPPPSNITVITVTSPQLNDTRSCVFFYTSRPIK
jgi:hypothetical protein